jgi:hypothetical protein
MRGRDNGASGYTTPLVKVSAAAVEGIAGIIN